MKSQKNFRFNITTAELLKEIKRTTKMNETEITEKAILDYAYKILDPITIHSIIEEFWNR